MTPAKNFTEQIAHTLSRITGVVSGGGNKDCDDADSLDIGLTDSEQALLARATGLSIQNAKVSERRRQQELIFAGDFVAFACVADQHLGSPATDVAAVFEDAAWIAETPGVFAFQVGDLIDNFINPHLLRKQFESQFTIPEEWKLAKVFLKLIGQKLAISVAGNHENWLLSLGGIDFFQEILLSDKTLHDAYEVAAVVKLYKDRNSATSFELPICARHSWRAFGSSQWNPTHAIEKATKFGGRFLVGIGAHTHLGGLARDFTSHGEKGIAIRCGTYQRDGTYARSLGYTAQSSMPDDCQIVVLFVLADGGYFAVAGRDTANSILQSFLSSGLVPAKYLIDVLQEG